MSDSIKNRITRACQCTGYKSVAYTAGTSAATHEVSYINIPYDAIVTDVRVTVTDNFVCSSSGKVHPLAGTAAGTVYNQSDGSAGTADPDGKSLSAITSKVTDSAAGVLLGTKPPYSLSSTYGSSGEEKVVPVTLSWTVTAGTVSEGALIWWVEYMFPANIVWDQASI
jgi:hypothetical protein